MEKNEQNENIANIPYIVYESAQSRMERNNKRLVIALVIAIILIFLSNAVWLYAWMQYDYVTTDTAETSTIDIDAKYGTANYIGNDGDIINGTDKSDKDEGYSDKIEDSSEKYWSSQKDKNKRIISAH